MTVAAAPRGASYPYGVLLALLAAEPSVALVCVASARGSTPREAGAAMIVTPSATIGTIGGGRLEFEAVRIARDRLSSAAAAGSATQVRFPLAASVGQCCGGVANLAFAVFAAADRDWLAQLDATVRSGARVAAVIGLTAHGRARMSISAIAADGSLGDASADAAAIALVRARLAQHPTATLRATLEQAADFPILVHLPVSGAFDVLVFGNGHVGRALTQVLSALPARVRWIDAREADFPPAPPPNIEIVATDVPEAELRAAPPGSYVVISTHSHALDFDLIATALTRDDWAYLGMIGSRAKRAQLVRRLTDRGWPADVIDRVVCPIGSGAGLPRSKEPGTIAVAVAAEILALREAAANHDRTGSGPAAA